MDMHALKFNLNKMLCERLYLEKSPEELGDSEDLYALSSMDANGIFSSLSFWKFNVAAHKGELSEEQLRTPAGILEFIQARLYRIQHDRTPLIAEITQAFDGVSREDGVTLHETEVIDAYGTAAERVEARKKDTEQTWQGVSYKALEQFSGVGGQAFFDAKGLRYYLPVYMIWTLKNFETSDLIISDFTIYTFNMDSDHKKERLAILNTVQRRAVAHFLEYMSLCMRCDHGVARKALEKHWKQYLDIEIEPEQKRKRRGKK